MTATQQVPVREPGRSTRALRASAAGRAEAVSALLARVVVLSVAVLLIVLFALGALGPPLRDVDAYWNAATRLRAGEGLYVTYSNPAAAEVYRYGPWFGYLWTPLTFLPRPVVYGGWLAVIAAAWMLSLRHVLDRDGVLVAALVGALLFSGVQSGNVQPILVAALVVAAGSRWEPVAIGVAASLKAFPILLALVYVGRRDWGRAGLALGTAALMTTPLLLHDVSEYPISPELTLSVFSYSPYLWAAAAVACLAATISLARARWAWLAAAVTVLATLPRLIFYDVGYLLVASKHYVLERRAEAQGSSST
jgi:hypothetical protein